MGYYVTLVDADFTIPADKLKDAYDAMCELNTTHEHMKLGRGTADSARWFSWMDTNYPQTCKNAKEVLEQVGFDVSEDDDGSISLCYYDSKSGQEELFIAAAGQFAIEGWYLEWRGEDGALWMHDADGLHEGTVVYN